MTAYRLAKRSLLLFAFALFWMKDPLIIGGLPAIPADLLFVLTGLLWLFTLLAGSTRIRWSTGFWPLLLYFGALAISAAFSTEPRTSAFKLATEAYLLAIPALVYNLVDTWDDLKRLFLAYLGGAAIATGIGTITLLLFPFLGPSPLLAWTLQDFGALPPGPYPRLEVTFDYAAMMANYLGLALMVAILAARKGWIPPGAIAWIFMGSITVTAFFALTPGFGGIVLMVGVWLWYRHKRTALGRVSLAAGLTGGLLEIPITAVTPIIHRTAPFLIHVPGLERPLAPGPRLLTWMNAARTFRDHPLTGCGTGVDPVHVAFLNPSGDFGYLTDAHDMPLSVAAQTGVLGVAGIAAVILYAAREMIREREMAFGLGLAFLSCLLVQGLVGSFEDARHVWFALGLLLAARKLEREAGAG